MHRTKSGTFEEDEITEVSASAPLVDFDNAPDGQTGPTAETDMATMPETRTAAQRTLATLADEERRKRHVRDGSAPLRRSATVCTMPPREARDSRSMASPPPERPAVGDMKAGLTSSRPKLSINPLAPQVHQCRAMEYGADFYRRGNYHGSPPLRPDGTRVTPAERVMGYIDAAMRHLTYIADKYNKAVGTSPDLALAATAHVIDAVDDVAIGKPPSGLPHLSHAMASLGIAIQCAVDDGLLPADPGQPWREGKVTEDRSPEAAMRFAGSYATSNERLQVSWEVPADRGQVVAPEPLWHGYRHADVLIAQDAAFSGFEHRFKGETLQLRFINADGDEANEWKDDSFGGFGEGSDQAIEECCRKQGLRRPDEPDYKPLA